MLARRLAGEHPKGEALIEVGLTGKRPPQILSVPCCEGRGPLRNFRNRSEREFGHAAGSNAVQETVALSELIRSLVMLLRLTTASILLPPTLFCTMLLGSEARACARLQDLDSLFVQVDAFPNAEGEGTEAGLRICRFAAKTSPRLRPTAHERMDSGELRVALGSKPPRKPIEDRDGCLRLSCAIRFERASLMTRALVAHKVHRGPRHKKRSRIGQIEFPMRTFGDEM